MAHRVVSEITGQATAETWQTRAQRHFIARLEFSDEIERIAFAAFDDLVILEYFNARAVAA